MEIEVIDHDGNLPTYQDATFVTVRMTMTKEEYIEKIKTGELPLFMCLNKAEQQVARMRKEREQQIAYYLKERKDT
jgi:hypothetical protein